MNTVDTARILVDWKCNLKCSYCCNEQERFRSGITPIKLGEIDFSKYKVVCISGGEPLLFLDRVQEVCGLTNLDSLRIIYSNGLLWTDEIARKLVHSGVNAANIGLHYPHTFHKIIHQVELATLGLPITTRYHVWEKYKDEMLSRYPAIPFRFWTMNDCDRSNEDRFILTQ